MAYVTTDGSVEISKRDASRSLRGSQYESLYHVKDWDRQESESSSKSEVATAPEAKSNKLAESQKWTNEDGDTITAAVLKVEKGNVYFLMPDGKVVLYPASQLSPDTIAKIKALIE